jgi:tRNA 2-thiouridine synthesizing protein A
MPVTLDAQGLKCPLPVLKARKALRDVAAGDVLTVLATDPSAVKDFKAFCEETAHAFVDSSQDGEVYAISIRKGG